MSRQKSLYSQKALHQWTDAVAHAFPELTASQANGLAAWSFGMVIPLGTFLGSLLLGGMSIYDEAPWIPWTGAACALAYFLCTFGLLRSFKEQAKLGELVGVS